MGQAALSLTVSSVAAQIAFLATKHDNLDTGLERLAITADKDGRAAFWRTTKYGNAVVGQVAATANTTSLANGLAQWADPTSEHKTVGAILACLLPLNAKAAAELTVAALPSCEREAA